MPQAFIIMQIGNPQLDAVHYEVMVPAVKACDLDPKRVDKHNEGRLLKSEIVDFIESSDIIVADLTNERPNCYLEIGYAMGIDKFRNLILTAREDHHPDSLNYRRDGPKIHFDLSGYDILFWDPNDLPTFRSELESRMRRRQAILAPKVVAPSTPWDQEWISENYKIRIEGLKQSGKTGFMEVRFAVADSGLNVPQSKLLEAAEQAQIHTFGWPLGIVLSSDEDRPRPKTDGIVAEVAVGPKGRYDYWTLRRNGDFYLLKSLFEDERQPNQIFFNTRIVRITEALLYCGRLYTRLGLPAETTINIGVRHGGLKGRVLGAVGNRELWPIKQTITENEIYTEVATTLEGIERDLVDLVESLTHPLFVLFDFFGLSREVLEDIVNKFVEGKAT